MESRIEKFSDRRGWAAAKFVAAFTVLSFGAANSQGHSHASATDSSTTSSTASSNSVRSSSPRNFRAAVRVCAEANHLSRASTAHGPSDAEREAMHFCLTELGFLGPILDPRVGTGNSVSARRVPHAPIVRRATRESAIASQPTSKDPAKKPAREPSGGARGSASDDGIGLIPRSLPLSNVEFDEFGPAPATVDEPSGNVTGSESG